MSGASPHPLLRVRSTAGCHSAAGSLAAGLGAALVCASAAAQSKLEDAALERRADAVLAMASDEAVRFERTQTGAQMLGSLPVPAAQPSRQPAFQAATQTMLWARRQQLAVGVGVEQRWNQGGPADASLPQLAGNLPYRDAGVVVGVSLATGAGSSLVWQAPLQHSAAAGVAGQEPQMSLGLAFRKRDPYSDLKRGSLMKMEISRSSVVSVRPRGGRWSMVLSSKW